MQKLKARFSKGTEISPLSLATKEFIKGTGDQGLNSLPTILEACSSASATALSSQVEVLDIIVKYYCQNTQLSRQLRCIDLLRYLSDQQDNELFNLLSQGHPLLKSIDSNLKNSRAQHTLKKGTRILLDHLVRQPRVCDSIIELHAKHVNGISKPHKPTIILSDQEVVADDIEAAAAESDLLTTLVTDDKSDDSLVLEVYGRILNTKERLIRDVDTSTDEQQTVNLISAIENIERVLGIYNDIYVARRESNLQSMPSAARRSSDESGAFGDEQANSYRSGKETNEMSYPQKRNGKSRAMPEDLESAPASPVVERSSTRAFLTLDDDDDSGQGSSTDQEKFRKSTELPRSCQPSHEVIEPTTEQKTTPLRSNNPFAAKILQSASPVPAQPVFGSGGSEMKATKSHANPFTDNVGHSEGDLDDQWRTLKI